MPRPRKPGDLTKIGSRLRSRRLQLNLTQKHIADKLGVEPASVSGWERASAQASTDHLLGLGKLLNVSLEWILSGADGPEDAPAPAKKGERAKAGNLSVHDLQDFDLTVGDMAGRIHALYHEEGFDLSIRDAVAMALIFHKDAAPFSSDAAADAAICKEIERLRGFLRSLPKRIGDTANSSK